MTHWVDVARRLVPRRVRGAIQRVLPMTDVKDRWRRQRDPLAAIVSGEENRYGTSVRIGILGTRALFHTSYVAACQELSIPFVVLDLSADEWQEAVLESNCDLFVAWPDATLTPWAKMYKDRCDLIEAELGLSVFPSHNERWIYEDKIRSRDWLVANDLPHPKTWVFFDQNAALQFAKKSEMPLVFKTSFGAAATGVEMIKTRRRLAKVIRKAFRRGHVPAGHDLRDKQWRSVFLQRYLPDMREWRLVRIGDSYFGHPKGRQGEFFSGSGKVEWEIPSTGHLDFLHMVTEAGKFRSMAVDVFETPNGELLINELQTVFGASTAVDQMRKNGRPGRMLRNSQGDWEFEFGDFSRNACCDERIRYALSRFEKGDQIERTI